MLFCFYGWTKDDLRTLNSFYYTDASTILNHLSFKSVFVQGKCDKQINSKKLAILVQVSSLFIGTSRYV